MARVERCKILLRFVSFHRSVSIAIAKSLSSGDSYTQTGFDPKSTQPSATNPFGNPPWPGWTSSNGPNWVGFLTATYNTTKIQTYNLAYGGATVDSALVAPYTPTVLSLKNQVQDQFVPIYGSHPSSAPWKDNNSLFAFWIGINDVGNSWWLSNATALYDQIFTVYDGLLESVYATGARNFLFLSVPPVNLAPLTLANGDYAIENEGKMIETWNAKLKNLTTTFSKRHNNTPRIFIHDTHTLFTNVINNPKSYEQTAGLKNTTGYCTAYEKYVPLLLLPSMCMGAVVRTVGLDRMIMPHRLQRIGTDNVTVAHLPGTRLTRVVCTP
jgi:phospholipase/lecithinase/hemolysin